MGTRYWVANGEILVTLMCRSMEGKSSSRKCMRHITKGTDSSDDVPRKELEDTRLERDRLISRGRPSHNKTSRGT